MPGSYCRVCKRRLKNPISVNLGIGPVCRGKNHKQGEFNLMHAQTALIKHERGKRLLARGIGHKTGRGAADGAECIAGQLCLEYGSTGEG